MIDLRQERYESVPEFVREPRTASRTKTKTESLIASAFKRDRATARVNAFTNAAYSNATYSNSAYGSTTNAIYEDLEFGSLESGLDEDFSHPRSAELETLWPGVDHDFLHVSQRGPSFYLSVGFLAGAVASLAALWVYAWFTHSSLTYTAISPTKKTIVTASSTTTSNASKTTNSVKPALGNAEVTTVMPTNSNADLVVPAFNTYEVKTGDTLVVIAVKAYHRASPRLLDVICKANGMRSADVLSLGQKLSLPEYRPSINQASGVQ